MQEIMFYFDVINALTKRYLLLVELGINFVSNYNFIRAGIRKGNISFCTINRISTQHKQ